MQIQGNKKVVCITGSVWTGGDEAPRHMLVKDGFVRPTWFTTGQPLTDANYRQVSETQFHMAKAEKKVLAHIQYRASFIGVMMKDFEAAMGSAERGVLMTGPPEIAALLAAAIPGAIIFALEAEGMDLSKHLSDAQRTGQLHRLDVDVLEPGAWSEVHRVMLEVIGVPPKT